MHIYQSNRVILYIIDIYMSEWVYMYIYQSRKFLCTETYPWLVLIHAFHYYLHEWVYMYIYKSNRVILYIIIIYMTEWVYMYIYQSSRVTVAVTGVCTESITNQPMQCSNCSSNKSMQLCIWSK